MRTYHRPFIYESNDFESLCKFIVEDHSVRKDAYVWHIGRLVDWKYNLGNFKRHFPGNYSESTHLWFNYFHELVGFILTEEFNHEFTVFLKNEYACLYPDMLGWARETWGNRHPKLMTSVVENQTEYRAILEASGYIRNNYLEMTRAFDTGLYKDFTMDDPSVSLQSMAENKDYAEQAVLRNSAWPKSYDDEIDSQIKEYIRKSPIYNAAFDFVLVNKEGRHLSGCEAFIDIENKTAEIERVCTHSDYYNKGYSQMALKACMRKLYENNIPRAYLTGGYDKTIYLYGKLGHISEYARYFYELDTRSIT